MKIVDFGCAGGPNVLRMKEVPKPTLRSHQIMIQVAAAGLNVHDTWCRQDIPFYRYDFGPDLGYECSGKVVAVGSKVIKFKKGDECVPHLMLTAALPEASRLIFYALSVLVNVTPGKTILIHGAAGGIDIIAIQYAKHIGCEVFVVTGMEEKLKLCKMLGAQVCINYNKEDFCKRVKAETGEKGVDIILDVSGRDHFHKNLDCLARGGSLVILGHKIGDQVDIDLSFLMKKDVRVIGADITKINILDVWQLMSDAAAKFWSLIEAGHVKPIIGKIFTFAEAAEAHRALEKSSIPGKLLLVPPEAAACDIHSPVIQGLINRFRALFS